MDLKHCEYYSAIKKCHILLIHANIWMNPKTCIGERNETQKSSYHVASYIRNSIIGGRKLW